MIFRPKVLYLRFIDTAHTEARFIKDPTCLGVKDTKTARAPSITFESSCRWCVFAWKKRRCYLHDCTSVCVFLRRKSRHSAKTAFPSLQQSEGRGPSSGVFLRRSQGRGSTRGEGGLGGTDTFVGARRHAFTHRLLQWGEIERVFVQAQNYLFSPYQF